MDRATELALIKRLRQQAYRSREDRLQAVKRGELSTIDAAQLTVDELMYLLPGRKIEWLVNAAPFTDHPDEPIWLECEAIVDVSTRRLIIDTINETITFQDRGCSTRTVRIKSIFTLTVRIIPMGAVDAPKRVPRHMRKKLQQKKVVVG